MADFGAKVFDEEPEKALSFDCTLKISNSQMKEAGYKVNFQFLCNEKKNDFINLKIFSKFKEMVVENATEILFEFANVYAKNIAFPELVNPINNQVSYRIAKGLASLNWNFS